MKKIKELFSTPKKAVITSVCIIAILVIVGACGIYAAESVAQSGSIGNEKAQYFAFADAGIDPEAAELVRTEFDHEQGQFVYEVEFIHEGTEYEYWIRASDGSVVKKDTEILSSALAKADIASNDQNKAEAEQEDALQTGALLEVEQKESENTQQTSQEKTDNRKQAAQEEKESGQQASEEKTDGGQQTAQEETQKGSTQDSGLEAAKSAALADAGLTDSQVTFTKTKLDYDDGISVYELEFYTDTHEYEYDVNASTGKVISKSTEAFYQKNGNAANGSGSSDSYIGVDQAKSIAVKHAGLTLKDVTFSKAKLENDDGYTVYEVEFYKNRSEYEYKIDALTGDILEYDAEQD